MTRIRSLYVSATKILSSLTASPIGASKSPEAASPSGEQYGEERLREAFVAGIRADDLFDHVRDHRNGVAQVDDVTFVLLELEGP